MTTGPSQEQNGDGQPLPWYGHLPNGWRVQRARTLFRERPDRSEDGSEELLSVSHLTGVTARSQKNVSMFLAETLEGYKVTQPDDLVVNTMWAWMGAIGVSELHGCVSPSYAVYRSIGDDFSSRYLDFLVRSSPFIAEVNRRSKGIWASRLRLYPDAFLDIPFPIPPLGMQLSISETLDRETARIDRLIEKKERIADLIKAKWEAIIYEARDEPGSKWTRLQTISRRVQRPVKDSENALYVPLGLLNRGRGFFEKLETSEEDLGESDFFWVREGDIVFSGQFAWEGAIGFVSAAEDGRIVSHRYPVYRASEGVEGAYLYAFFRTAHGAFLMDNCSRGAAGRNRPLNTWSLERELILVPPRDTQQEIARLVALELSARRLITKYIEKASELRTALVSAAVLGQVEKGRRPPVIGSQANCSKFPLIVGAEIIHQHRSKPKFGRVKLQKELYLVEAHLGISELQGNYVRQAAGPLDRALIEETERAVAAAGYYRASQADGAGTTVTYTPLSNAGHHNAELKSLLGPRAEALSGLVALLRDFGTAAVEAIATLYAVWNDALIDGQQPDDSMIVNGVLTEWHEEKGKKFKDSDLHHWLDWMKRNGLTPRGQGPRTAHTIKRDLFA